MTPNALPPTVIQLGDKFNAAITLKTARNVESVEIVSIGVRGSKRWSENGINYPYHLVDVRYRDNDGELRIVRSGRITNKKASIAAQREATRKIAMFLFENRNVSI